MRRRSSRRGAREYVGVDASAEMLARGRARLGDDPRVRLIVGDVTRAPREAFDVALFCLVLEHFETLEAPLAAAARRATPRRRRSSIFELHPAWWHDGGRAHYVVDGKERALASWPHDEPEFARALPAHGLELVTARTWYAHEAACTRSPKLRKRLGKPVLLDVTPAAVLAATERARERVARAVLSSPERRAARVSAISRRGHARSGVSRRRRVARAPIATQPHCGPRPARPLRRRSLRRGLARLEELAEHLGLLVQEVSAFE